MPNMIHGPVGISHADYEKHFMAKTDQVNQADPWAHRAEGMRCKTCMWFAPKRSDNKPFYDVGRCRRHAPSVGGYPVVMVNDWCGDHRLDENK